RRRAPRGPKDGRGDECRGREALVAFRRGAGADAPDPGLAARERAPHAAVPVPPVVLGVRAGGPRGAWCGAGLVARDPKAGTLSPLGGRRPRPGPSEHTFAHESRLTDV